MSTVGLVRGKGRGCNEAGGREGQEPGHGVLEDPAFYPKSNEKQRSSITAGDLEKRPARLLNQKRIAEKRGGSRRAVMAAQGRDGSGFIHAGGCRVREGVRDTHTRRINRAGWNGINRVTFLKTNVWAGGC